jgi:hypothetical protein
MRKIVPIANKVPLKGFDEKQEDLAYWLTRTPQERIMAVTMLVRQSLSPGQRMDKEAFGKRKFRS